MNTDKNQNLENAVQNIVDAINSIEGYCFKENPNPIAKVFLSKIEKFGKENNISLPNRLRSTWNKIYLDTNTLSDESLEKLQNVIDEQICQSDKDSLMSSYELFILVLVKENCLDLALFFNSVIGYYILWHRISSLGEYDFKTNPCPALKLIIDKYLNVQEMSNAEFPDAMNGCWEYICKYSNNIPADLAKLIDDQFISSSKESSYEILETASFLANMYSSLFYSTNHNLRPEVIPSKLEEINSIRVSLATSALWEIANSSHIYSFKKDPLPVFQVLVDYYKSNHHFRTEIPSKWLDTLEELETFTSKCINTTSRPLFEKFKEALDKYVKHDEEVLAGVVNFFVDKYAENNIGDGGEMILSDKLIEFIYWYAVGTEADTAGLAMYNPFANICSFGAKHIVCINNQREMYDDKGDNDWYVTNPWYHGVESNVTNRLIGSVRLFVNTPSNLNQIYITADDSLEDEIDGYTGGWTYIATPPVASNDIAPDTLVEIITKSIEKFLAPESIGMEDAFFILPRVFCANPEYNYVRKQLVCSGVLSSVIDLPKNVFKQDFEGILIHLCKFSKYGNKTANDRGYIKFLNAGNYTGKCFNDLLDDKDFCYCFWDTNDIESLKDNTYLKKISYATVIDHGYYLLPELYIPSPIQKKTNEVPVRLANFLEYVPSQRNLQESGLCISTKSFLKDIGALFKYPEFEEMESGTYAEKHEGAHIVLMYNDGEFLLCKTSENSEFYLSDNQVALKLRDDSPLSLEYVIYGLLRSKYLERLALSNYDVTYNILNCEILVELDKSDRTNTMSEVKNEYEKKLKEEEAKRMREAQREATSDIAHMLGTSFSNIGNSLFLLKNQEGCGELYEKLKGNFDHIQRVLQNVGKDYSIPTIKNNVLVNKFFEEYINSQKYYGKKTFSLDFSTDVANDASFYINETFMYILLDTLLDNAYRHGFERKRSADHKVSINVSNVLMKGKSHILLKVANNGANMPDVFSIEDYITRGVTIGDTGRSGLGGKHIYDITKQHNGFLYITKDEEWNFIVEILIPSNDNEQNIAEYENAEKCI